MNFKIIGIIAGVLLLLVIIGGVGYKIVAPTSKTVIGNGGKQVILNTDRPQIPLGGCSIYKLNTKLFWESNYRQMNNKEVIDDKRTDKSSTRQNTK